MTTRSADRPRKDAVPEWVLEQLREIERLVDGRHQGTWHHASPAAPVDPDQVEICWRATNSEQDQIVCGIYRTHLGLQLRAMLGKDVIDREAVATLAQGRTMAAGWRRAAIDNGFTDVR